MIASRNPELIFEGGFGDRDEMESRDRGYRSHVCVKLASGERYPVVFYDADRLQQDLEVEAKTGNAFIAEPGLIVLPEVTLQNMQKAIEQLAKQGFFECLRPIDQTLADVVRR
jgi:hypothetical protein